MLTDCRHRPSPRLHCRRGPTLLLLLLLAPLARAEVLTWSADAPFAAGNSVTVDFGARLTGITAVEAVVTGTGGEQRWIIYQGVGNPTGSVPFEMFLDVAPVGGGGGGGASVWLPLLAPFAEGLSLAPVGDWTWLEDGMLTLDVSYVHAPFPDVPMCYGSGYTLPVVAHLDLVVTCAAAVPTEATSWGAIKAGFR